jgi:sulfite reductase (ferredoxin)
MYEKLMNTGNKAMETQVQVNTGDALRVVAKKSHGPTQVEGIKEASQHLRGSIAAELWAETDHFEEANKQLLKFHGTYQQEDRDARKSRREEGKQYRFMVRCKIPGGRLSGGQYLAVDDLAGRYADGTLRFTTRQGIQLHGVIKSSLHETIAGINATLLTTLGACGDVARNVMACPAPHDDERLHQQLQETADLIAAQLSPRTRAYHEIWLDDALVQPTPADRRGGPEAEPLYGRTYLPRKFKTGLALPDDNCIDIYTQDLGLLAIVDGERILGYNVLVGGGMGMTHGNAHTFPHLAQPVCYVPARAVVGVAEAVVKLFRDHGNRGDRKRARLKYVVHDWGIERFREVLAEYVGGQLELPRETAISAVDSHLGWHAQGQGRWYYGLSIENGRVKDSGSMRLRSGLRALIEHLQPELRLTPFQDVLLCGLEESAREEIERKLAEYGVLRPDQISKVKRFSLACPAIPTCGLALTEAERALPQFLPVLEAELKRLGLENECLSVRMTGCPNGCARPYQSDIGIVGRSGDKYTLFVGGSVLGTRLNFMLKDLVPFSELVPTLRPILVRFAAERFAQESFGDFCQRMGEQTLREWLGNGDRETGEQKHAEKTPTLTACNGNSHTEAVHANKGHGHQAHENNGIGLLQIDREKLAAPAGIIPAAQEGNAVVVLAVPEATPAVSPESARRKRSEIFMAGPEGHERRDYAYCYRSDGSVKETAVYFYGDDWRASAAHLGEPLRREARYAGKVNAFRLHEANKLSDTYYVGSADEERADRRVDYRRDGEAGLTVVFFYGAEMRAEEAAAGTAVSRQVVFEGARV